MKELDVIRKSLDAIDSQLAHLFEERMKQIDRIGHLKCENDIPIPDLEREKVIRKRNADLIENPAFRPYFDRFYDTVISLSKQFQKTIYEEQHR